MSFIYLFGIKPSVTQLRELWDNRIDFYQIQTDKNEYLTSLLLKGVTKNYFLIICEAFEA